MAEAASDTTMQAEQQPAPVVGAPAPQLAADAPARTPAAPLDEQRARFERARAAERTAPPPRAPPAQEPAPTITGAEAMAAGRAGRASQRARTRAQAAGRDRAPRTIMEQLERAQVPEDLAKLFDFAAERGLLAPGVARAAGAAVRSVGSVAGTARVMTPADAAPAQALPVEGAQPAPAAGTEPAAPAPPAEPELIMGQPAHAVDLVAEPARAMAKLALDFAARHGLDLRTGDARVLFKGKSIEREVSPDLTVPLSEALAAAMAKRAPKGLAGAADPDKVLLALLAPIALPLAKSVLASAAGPLMSGARAVANGLRGILRRRAQ